MFCETGNNSKSDKDFIVGSSDGLSSFINKECAPWQPQWKPPSTLRTITTSTDFYWRKRPQHKNTILCDCLNRNVWSIFAYIYLDKSFFSSKTICWFYLYFVTNVETNQTILYTYLLNSEILSTLIEFQNFLLYR